MADDKTSVTWDINVQTGSSDQEVEKLAATLDHMRQSMQASTGELKVMQQSLANLKKGGASFKAQADVLKSEIEAKKKFIAQTQLDWIKLGGAKLANQQKPKPPVDPAKLSQTQQAMRALGKAVQESDTALGRLTSRVMHFGNELGKSRLIAVGMAVALGALVAVSAVWTKRLTEIAVAAGDARRNEYLHLEALTRQRTMFARTSGNAKEMQTAIDGVSSSVSISRTEVASLATQLHNSGLRGKNFATVLEAASIKASALGSAAGSAFAGFAVDLQHAGGSAARAAQDIKNRFGDVVQNKMKSLDVQSAKLKENIDSLFTGLDVEPILTANKAWNDMFSASTETGKAIRSFATAALQPIINSVTTLWNYTRRFFKQMIIGLLELGIYWRMLKLTYIRALGGPDQDSAWGKLFTWLKPGRVLVYMLAAAFAAMAVSVAAAAWPVLLAGTAIWGLFEIIQQLYALWNEIDWSGLGTAIWQGIVNGLKAGWNAIKSVASELADGVSSAFKLALGIESPSKVFAEHGLQIARGVKVGVDQGAPAASAAASKLVQPPPNVGSIGAAPAAGAARGGGGSVTLTIAELKVIVGDDTTAKGVAAGIRRELESVLAGLAEQVGASRSGVPA